MWNLNVNVNTKTTMNTKTIISEEQVEALEESVVILQRYSSKIPVLYNRKLEVLEELKLTENESRRKELEVYINRLSIRGKDIIDLIEGWDIYNPIYQSHITVSDILQTKWDNHNLN